MSQHMNLMRRSGGQRKEACFPNKTSSCSTKDTSSSCIKGNYGDKSSNIILSKSHLMDPIESPEDIEKWKEERRRRFPRFKQGSTVEGDRLEGGGLPGYRRCEKTKKTTTKMTTRREEGMRRRRPTLFQQLMKLQEERERVPSQASSSSSSSLALSSLPPSSSIISEKRDGEREKTLNKSIPPVWLKSGRSNENCTTLSLSHLFWYKTSLMLYTRRYI